MSKIINLKQEEAARVGGGESFGVKDLLNIGIAGIAGFSADYIKCAFKPPYKFAECLKTSLNGGIAATVVAICNKLINNNKSTNTPEASDKDKKID